MIPLLPPHILQMNFFFFFFGPRLKKITARNKKIEKIHSRILLLYTVDNAPKYLKSFSPSFFCIVTYLKERKVF